tara:strand:- start:477 stop:686 length:210 start_codon:yes stop_codon:yes gene_type:complete
MKYNVVEEGKIAFEACQRDAKTRKTSIHKKKWVSVTRTAPKEIVFAGNNKESQVPAYLSFEMASLLCEL